MAEENVPALAPTRSDKQILPFKAWLHALDITPVDPAHPFMSPPAGEQVMDFVNELGYPEEIHFVSRMHVNNLFQPWRAIMSLINQCLTGKTSGNDKPRHPVLQMLWGDDFLLGNLKFVPKGEKDEAFGKPIRQELISEAIQQSPYYEQYLEMAARKHIAKEGGKKKTTSKADKPKKPAPTKQSKPMKEKTTKPSPTKKVRKVEDDEYNLQRGIQMSLESFQAPVSGVAIHEPASDAEIGADTERSNSEVDTKILDVAEEQGEDVSNTVDLEERTVELDEGQARSDPGNTLEYRPSPDEDQAGSNPGQSHVALAKPNPEPIHEDFIAIVYPKVHKSLKHTTEEHVFLENPPSSSGTLS
ncbi:hypothetical protein Tco_0536988 [Tanacetum coccineum]